MMREAVATLAVLFGMGIVAVAACSNDAPSRGDDGPHSVTGALDATTDAPDYGSVPGRLPDGAPLPGGECLTDVDCTGPGNQRCLYAVGAVCGTTGICTTVAENAPGCAEAGLLDPSETTACSCDGTPRIQVCALPEGYTRGDIVHPGPCADGGQECTPGGNDCPGRQICGFRVSDGCSVTTAHCFDGPDPTIAIPGALLDECSCDGGVATTFPDTADYVTAPVRGRGQCPGADSGVDAAADAEPDAADASPDSD